MRVDSAPERSKLRATGIALLAALAGGGASGCLHVRTPPLDDQARAALREALPLRPDSAVAVAVADIARCRALAPAFATAAIAETVLDAAAVGIVITMGDHAYDNGSRDDFERCYEPTWGRFNSRTFPSPGNHDMATSDGAPYYDYFVHYRRNPAARARGYYSFELGGWHLLALNSLLPLERGAAQLEWLQAELRRVASRCTLAYWHHPLVSSGWHGGFRRDPGRRTADAWRVLEAHRAELVLNGHDHIYERFMPRDASGAPHADGIVQFIVGTGGGKAQPVLRRRPGSAFLQRRGHGVLVLVLHADSYEWAFVGADGSILDRSSGKVPCH